jgi:hypothetical protein
VLLTAWRQSLLNSLILLVALIGVLLEPAPGAAVA